MKKISLWQKSSDFPDGDPLHCILRFWASLASWTCHQKLLSGHGHGVNSLIEGGTFALMLQTCTIQTISEAVMSTLATAFFWNLPETLVTESPKSSIWKSLIDGHPAIWKLYFVCVCFCSLFFVILCV